MGFEVIGEDTPLSWDKFEKLVQSDIDDVRAFKVSAKGMLAHGNWVYRGQHNSNWKLETTFERYFRDDLKTPLVDYPIAGYYHYLSSIIPSINSLTNHRFDDFVPDNVEVHSSKTLPHYRLLCFARHHGFPTPMLDWTASYYVSGLFRLSPR